MKLPLTQRSLLIRAVFKRQKTEKVLSKLASLSIVVVSVPANMTLFFQPLNLTVNGEAKRFMKDKFTTWYPEEVHKQINPGNGDANGEVSQRRFETYSPETSPRFMVGGPVQPSQQ